VTIRVCTFSGASSLPLVVAQEQGLFAAAGLDVDLVETRSSDELMGGLVDGTFAIVHAAPDNFVAWRDRMGAPIVAWIGGASGPLALVARPGIGSVAELRGRSIAVDAPSSGFVSVLRKILRGAGVSPDEVTLDPIGATHLRAAALREGRTDATMLTLPWSAAAIREGLPVLADGRAVLPRLQGGTGGSLESWLGSEPESADTYLRALVAALTWLQLPANLEAARELVARRYGVDAELAEDVRAAFTDPRAGWPPSALVDAAGIAAVCELRAENGQPPLHPPATYVSLEPYRRVFGFGLVG
jgi:ABC-type nitrate/sulfonate/bicarbonate transport system substrate-binding protein